MQGHLLRRACLQQRAHCCSTAGGKGTVDLQLITSAGASIALGQVVVPQGGPVFQVDGMGRSEINTNTFGMGTMKGPGGGACVEA